MMLDDTTKFFTSNVFLKANTKNFMQRDGCKVLKVSKTEILKYVQFIQERQIKKRKKNQASKQTPKQKIDMIYKV